ncbi:hypothetical protein JOD45_001426 [Scopulibacillus daqui]|uniref:FbpB family small basic protein n=1 Tax=Scopulibacillus daqui TaxID=1469162 RepID=A0ABS2PYV6_9BACL|nr:FbpB family small basic protein [Scopulibacillus daqui]MBM7645215.1 hypothetical protein [Scopulibacillus daqui]
MKKKVSFKDLVSKNKSEILRDHSAIEKIELKIEKKRSIR